MSEELKACAHCGGKAEIERYEFYKAVVCCSCRSESPANSVADAVMLWNRRTPDLSALLLRWKTEATNFCDQECTECWMLLHCISDLERALTGKE